MRVPKYCRYSQLVLEYIKDYPKCKCSEVAEALVFTLPSALYWGKKLHKKCMIKKIMQGHGNLLEITDWGIHVLRVWKKEIPDDKQYCAHCKQALPFSEFSKDSRTCKRCKNETSMERYYKENPEPGKLRTYERGGVKREIIPRGEIKRKPVAIKPPEGSIRKNCPTCSGWIWITPGQTEGQCLKCGRPWRVNERLSKTTLEASLKQTL